MSFKDQLKALRKAVGLTQSEVADRLGVGRTTVSMWETGDAFPRADMLPAIAKLYGCSIDDLRCVTNETKKGCVNMDGVMASILEKHPDKFTGEVLATAPRKTPEQEAADRAYTDELEALAAPLVNWIREQHGYHTEVHISADYVSVKHDGAGLPFPL